VKNSPLSGSAVRFALIPPHWKTGFTYPGGDGMRRSSGDLIRDGGSATVSDSYVRTSAAEYASTAVAKPPELRKQTSATKIVLGRLAREVISDDLFRTSRVDGAEAGGFLFSRPVRSWDKIPS
jgi:hypothetical protein